MKPPLKPWACKCGRGIVVSVCERIGHPKRYCCAHCVKAFWDGYWAEVAQR